MHCLFTALIRVHSQVQAMLFQSHAQVWNFIVKDLDYPLLPEFSEVAMQLPSQPSLIREDWKWDETIVSSSSGGTTLSQGWVQHHQDSTTYHFQEALASQQGQGFQHRGSWVNNSNNPVHFLRIHKIKLLPNNQARMHLCNAGYKWLGTNGFSNYP